MDWDGSGIFLRNWAHFTARNWILASRLVPSRNSSFYAYSVDSFVFIVSK